MTGKVELQLRGAMDHLRIVWQVGEALLENVPFEEDPEGDRYNVLLAIQEMTTNVLRHAYQLDESRPIKLQFEVDDDRFTVAILDQGPAFDPLTQQEPEEPEDSANITCGGYGIMIAKMVMDDVRYERQGDWNVLSMWKAAVVPVGHSNSHGASAGE